MRQLPRGHLLHRGHLLLLDAAPPRVPAGGGDSGRLDEVAAQGTHEAPQPLRWRPIFLHPARPQRGSPPVQVHRGRHVAPRSRRPHPPQRVRTTEQYHRGSINFNQILPKKTYIEKHKGNPVRISSNISLEKLQVVGSWDEWAGECEMSKTFNPLKGSF